MSTSSYTASCTMNLRSVVHRCPAVPTQAKVAERITISRSASASTMRALLPPSSRRCLPNLLCTVSATSRPTAVLPVKETSLTRRSSARRLPTSVPPVHREQMAPGRPLRSCMQVRKKENN